MSSTVPYKCSRCEQPCKREHLTVVKVSFLTMGVKASTVKSRTTDWLCPACLVQDPIWTKKAYTAPGFSYEESVRLQAVSDG